MGSSFYRDNPRLRCTGHPECVNPCIFESSKDILHEAALAFDRGIISREELRCITMDLSGFPGKLIIGYSGSDKSGRYAHRARYACERAYAKIGRRVCSLCYMLWSAERPKGPRLDPEMRLRYPIERFSEVRRSQSRGPLKCKRRKGHFSMNDTDQRSRP